MIQNHELASSLDDVLTRALLAEARFREDQHLRPTDFDDVDFDDETKTKKKKKKKISSVVQTILRERLFKKVTKGKWECVFSFRFRENREREEESRWRYRDFNLWELTIPVMFKQDKHMTETFFFS